MNTLQLRHKYNNTKDFLFGYLNKEFLVFLFFLAVSATFWFLTALNNTFVHEVKVKLEMTDVPEDIVITQELPDSIAVTLKDKGFNLLRYAWGQELPTVRLAFANYAKGKNKGVVTPADIQRLLRVRLDETTTIQSVKAAHWEFYYCHGTKKKVPVLVSGGFVPRSNHYVSRIAIAPDSVMVVAEQAALDTIKAVYIEEQDRTDIHETATYSVPLQNITGAKIEATAVKMTIVADQLTEMTIKVPVRTVNVPEGTTLKTFPAQVTVRVAVGVRNTGLMKPESFAVVADYNELPTSSDVRMPLKLTVQPRSVVRATLMQTDVDYLIETDRTD